MKQHAEKELPPVIILAGGRSERYGSPKGLAKVGNETLLSSHISSFAQVGSQIVVVLGYYTDPYIAEIERTKVVLANPHVNVRYTVNKEYDLGPFSSIQCGLAELSVKALQGIFVQPVDTGIVNPHLFCELFNKSEQGTFSVIPEWQGKGGHPVFISADLTKRLPTLDPKSKSARLDLQLHAEPPGKVQRFPVADSLILENRNSPS